MHKNRLLYRNQSIDKPTWQAERSWLDKRITSYEFEKQFACTECFLETVHTHCVILPLADTQLSLKPIISSKFSLLIHPLSPCTY